MTAQVTTLIDDGYKSVIKITDRFDATADYSTIVVNTKSLIYASSSQTPYNAPTWTSFP